jgi:ribosomal-protein-alanine N-acetyltransferase
LTVPLPALETERLLLTPVLESDVAALHRLWTEPEVRRYLWDDIVIAESTARELVVDCLRLAEQESLGMWTVRRREVLGGIEGFLGLKHPKGSREIEILYGLEPSLWGLGLATEASAEVLEYAFSTLGLSRVVAGADPPNERSFMVMRRLGMTPLEEELETVPGVLYFSIDRETFRTRAAR